MNYTKTQVTGIDVPIQKAQKLLYDSLSVIWGTNLNGYGRVYLNNRGKSIIPEVFLSGNDYKDVLSLDDNRFFFVKSDSATRISNTRYESDIDIYFIVNLKEVIGRDDYRSDEFVHSNVNTVLNRTDFHIKGIETGIDNIISVFKLEDRDNFNLSDLEPYHIFKVECAIKYDLSKTECNG